MSFISLSIIQLLNAQLTMSYHYSAVPSGGLQHGALAQLSNWPHDDSGSANTVNNTATGDSTSDTVEMVSERWSLLINWSVYH